MRLTIELPPPEPGRQWIVEVERRSPFYRPAARRQRRRRWWHRLRRAMDGSG